MPLDSYTLIHSDANFSAAQKDQLVKYFRMVESEIRLMNNLPPEEQKK